MVKMLQSAVLLLVRRVQITSMNARNVLISLLILNMVVHATSYGDHQICTLLSSVAASPS